MFVQIQDLKVQYRTAIGIFGAMGTVTAVGGVSLAIAKGETLGLVGESGSGKSTLGRAVLRLTEATAGRVSFDGEELTSLNKKRLRAVRRKMQMIFQDPSASLNPKMTVRQTVAEPLREFGAERSEANARLGELLDTVGLGAGHAGRYPHELSGGQRQRVAVARALATDPEFIVADEPLASLDVSIQAQVMNLLSRLREQRGLTYLFISHDLRAVRHMSDRIAVMYLGRVVEIGPAGSVHDDPLMPYTKSLVSAVPIPDPDAERSRSRIIFRGEAPSPSDPPQGCPFRTRCPWAIDDCRRTVPELREIKPAHFAACIRMSPEKPHLDQ